MKKLLACAAALTMATAPVAPVRAASLNIDVDITLPQILILYCYDAVDVNIGPAAMATLLNTPTLTFAAEGTNGTAATAQITGVAPTVTAPNATTVQAALPALGASPAPTLGSKTLTINNICAVRGLVTGGSINVTATGPTTLTNGASSIGLGATWTGGTGLSVSLGTATAVNLSTTADFSGVTVPGTHSNATSDLVVTASLP